jgi:hypothetical protein
VNGLPPDSSAFWPSPSVSALAIHTASRWEARPVSAVTRPPVPRLTSPSSWNVTGPRLETSTSGRVASLTHTSRSVLKICR